MEDDQTLIAALPDDLVVLRFSSISFTKKGEPSEDLAKSYIRKKASEDQHLYYEIVDKGVSVHEQQSEQNGEQLTIKYWYVGAKTTMVIVSATVVTQKLGEERVQQLLNSMGQIVEP